MKSEEQRKSVGRPTLRVAVRTGQRIDSQANVLGVHLVIMSEDDSLGTKASYAAISQMNKQIVKSI